MEIEQLLPETMELARAQGNSGTVVGEDVNRLGGGMKIIFGPFALDSRFIMELCRAPNGIFLHILDNEKRMERLVLWNEEDRL